MSKLKKIDSFQNCAYGKVPDSTFKLHKVTDTEYTGEYLYGVNLNQTVIHQMGCKAIKNRYYVYKNLPKRKKLYIKTNNGLSNRLRALASAYNILQQQDLIDN